MLNITEVYTGRPYVGRPPRLHSLVSVPESGDDREYDAFARWIKHHGLALEFVRWMPRAKRNVWRLVRSSNA